MSLNIYSRLVISALSLVCGILLLSPLHVLAQQATGTILGTITDPQGASVPGASVTATNTGTNLARTVPTGDDGAYRIPSLPVGNYEVRVTKDGFETNDRKGLVLEVGQEAVVNVSLAVGTTSQTVEVTEQAPLIDTTSASVGGVVDEQRVADLPLNGRNWSNLTMLQAGVAQSFLLAPSPTSAALPSEAGNIFVSNGGTTRSNNFMLDGAILVNLYGVNGASASGNSLGIDGIQEFRVITSLISAEYPLTGGSQTIIASKSGTNTFHGDGFEYLRNSSLDARNYFDLLDTNNARGFGTDKSAAWPDKRLPPYHRSDFGGSIGGPIQKDKTFFYAVYEGLDEHKGLSTTTNTLPAGCFNSAGTFLGVSNPTLPSSCGGGGTMTPAIQELLTQSDTGGPLNSAAFPSGAIFPAPNVTGAKGFNYSYPSVEFTNENYGQLRLDHNFSANDSAFVRFTQDQVSQIIPGNYLSAHTLQNSVDQYTTVSESHVFSPTLLQTLRFSFSRTLTAISLNSEVPGANEKSLVYDRGMGNVSPGSGVTGLSLVNAANYYQKIFTSSDDVIWTRGKHSIKMGAQWSHWTTPNAGLYFQYAGSISFSTLQQMFAGQYSSITFAPESQLVKTISYNTIGFYVQDDFRVLPRLTLNLGLRYEFVTNPNGPNNTEVQNPLTAAPPNFGLPGPVFTVGNASLHNFSPRLGFAWDVRGNGRTAVRGGAGIYYDVGDYGILMLQGNYNSLPHTYEYSFANAVTNPLSATPPGTGLLDPLASERNGCGDIVIPTYAPCPQGANQFNPQQPSMGQWALSVDQQLPWDTALSVNYVGSAAWHLWSGTDGNYVNATIDQNGNYIPLQTDSRGEPSYCILASDGTCAFTKTISATAANTAIQNLAFERQNPYLGAVDYSLTNARSWYNSLQVVVNKHITHGLQFQSSFTWAKFMDTAAEPNLADSSLRNIVPNGPNGDQVGKLNAAPSAYDIGHNWRFNAIYHFADIHKDSFWTKLSNGWWTAAIVGMQSGNPFTPTLGGGNRMLAVPQDASIVPNRAANFNAKTDIIGTQSEWFDPTQFALQPAGVNGNGGRDYLFGPSLANLDWSFNKDTKLAFLGEQGELQFRAEIFNILNHPNFALPSTSVFSLPSGATQASLPPGQLVPAGSLLPGTNTPNPYAALSTAGVISSTVTSSRQIQFALKFVF